jgi:hypothetical protein
MPNLTDVKAMAKALRAALAERGVTTTHSDCLDLVSRQHGHANWNTFRALIDRDGKAPAPQLPEGWIGAGSRPDRYRMGIDGQNAGTAVIESIADGEGFATLMQSIVADGFLGVKARLTASLRTRDVVGSAAIWLRVDGERGEMLRFDNLHTRNGAALSGTTEWTERAIVLDVPTAARTLHYGFLLNGTGAAWARGFRLDSAGDGDAVTRGSPYLDGPTNLDFSRPALDG